MKSFIYKLAIFLNRILPKHHNRQMVIFTDMGLGDLIMFMPTVQIFYESFPINFYGKRNLDVLKHNFPLASVNKHGRYGMLLANVHCQYQPLNIIKILLVRSSVRIGHDYGKARGIFNYLASFDYWKYRPQQNMNLAYAFFKPELPFDDRLFFNAKKIAPYTVIKTKSITRPDKDVIFDINPNIITRLIIFLGLPGEYDRELAQRLIERGHHITDKTGRTSIIEAADLINGAYECIFNDCGLAHIASALNVKTTVYYREGITQAFAMHKNINYIKI